MLSMRFLRISSIDRDLVVVASDLDPIAVPGITCPSHTWRQGDEPINLAVRQQGRGRH